MTVSVCIVGCGGYARSVVSDIREMGGLLELYFASRSASKAKQYCDEFGGAGFFGSYEDAAADPRVDAMYFFTPHHLHLDNARMAASNGKHVMMEKPIATTLSDGEELVRATEEAGVKLMVAENYRFLPTVTRCKELLANGALGKLRLINIQHEVFGQPKGWRRSLELRGGGGFIDGGIHLVDLMVSLGGLPTRIFAEEPPKVYTEAEGDDGMVVTCVLPGDAVGLINYSNASPRDRERRQVSVTCTNGELEFQPQGVELTISTRNGVRVERLPEGKKVATRAMMKEFVDSIAEDREPSMSGEAGLNDLAVVMAAYRSVQTGKAVSPDWGRAQ